MTKLLLPPAALFAMVVTGTPSEASANARHPHQQLEIVQPAAEIVQPSGQTLVDWVTTEFRFADDARLIAALQPDGGQRVHCYPDGAVRLSHAASGRGNVQGRAPPEDEDSYRYEYNEGDELERIIRESEGQIAELTVGAQVCSAKMSSK